VKNRWGNKKKKPLGISFFYLKGPVASAGARDPATTTWGLLESSRNLFRWMDGASSSSFQPFCRDVKDDGRENDTSGD
jgi:hypothetical protein